MEKHARIFVPGGDTLIGAALRRRLAFQRFTGLVGTPPGEPDLCSAPEVDDFFRRARPEYVFLAAGKSGGIRANQLFPADLMLDNLLSECHVIDAAHRHGVKKLLYIASSCSYPKHCPQPMRVESLMTGPLEPTNDAYATAKIAGITLCQAYARQHGANFISGIPANAFGLEDDFSPEGGHVIPALLAKIHKAKVESLPSVPIWGTGAPRREFIFADDLADACLFVMQEYDDAATPINLGAGEDLSIRETAELIREVVGYTGELAFDSTKPDGMPLKSLDSSPLIRMGWRAQTSFAKALLLTYEAFQNELRKSTQEGIHVRAAV
ncbi:MAG: GDP-L-fucose synthase [Planctomycetia bacterium]|nr:GDP-L-fucose synthase [Planctomycetia bacterium]